MRLEKRNETSAVTLVVAPFAAVAFTLLIAALLVLWAGAPVGKTYSLLLEGGFGSVFAWSETLTRATPLILTGLAATVAFKARLFNIGAEGQLYVGAIAAVAVSLQLGHASAAAHVIVMCLAGAAAGAAWALIPGVLRAFGRTSEILTSLMLNYAAGYLLNYLILDSHSYWRDTTSPDASTFPVGKLLPVDWPAWGSGVVLPLGFLIAVGTAVALLVLYRYTRFGFETQVIGDSPRAARYAGMRTRRKILAVMAISGGLAGMGGASQEGDFVHKLDPDGLQHSNFGYTGIVVAALGRYNPLAVIVVAFLIGGLQNAGYFLQGADFPSGLVGVMQGIILFCTLGGELLVRYRVTFGRAAARAAACAA